MEVAADAPICADSLFRFYHAGDEETFALRGVSMSVMAGEMVAVVGPSGSGKSTLLNCLAGLDDPDGGTVWLSGVRMSRQPEPARAALRRSAVGLLFQQTNLFDHLTVEGNLTLVQRLAGGDDRARRDEVLDRLGIAGRRGARPGMLSGGELARAGMAVAVINRPPVLLADEPTGEVDASNELRLIDLLRQQSEAGAAVIVVTHSSVVSAAADRVLELVDGVLST